MKDIRQRGQLKKPTWILALVSLVILFWICANIYPPQNSAPCYFLFTSHGCKAFQTWRPPALARELTNDELVSRVVVRDILNIPFTVSVNAKIAFMFLTPGSLPFEKLWDKFFQGYEGRFTVYIHATKNEPVHFSRYFVDREIRNETVEWGKISMVDAQRRILANALLDVDNQHFVLLSESCIPLRDFDYVYSFLMSSSVSFIDCFEDLGIYGSGRYTENMLPEVEKKDFRKGTQWFTMKRHHALIVVADSLYYKKFKNYCKPDTKRHDCNPDEHYFPTLFFMLDPAGIANWSVTYVDLSERKWHPKSYQPKDITLDLMRNITSIVESRRYTSSETIEIKTTPCLHNGTLQPCYLFGRKFLPDTLNNLLQLFPDYTSIELQ